MKTKNCSLVWDVVHTGQNTGFETRILVLNGRPVSDSLNWGFWSLIIIAIFNSYDPKITSRIHESSSTPHMTLLGLLTLLIVWVRVTYWYESWGIWCCEELCCLLGVTCCNAICVWGGVCFMKTYLCVIQLSIHSRHTSLVYAEEDSSDVVCPWRAESPYDERPEQSYDTDHPHRHPLEYEAPNHAI